MDHFWGPEMGPDLGPKTGPFFLAKKGPHLSGSVHSSQLNTAPSVHASQPNLTPDCTRLVDVR